MEPETTEAPLPFPFAPAPAVCLPSPALAEVRETCPVTRVRLPDGTQAWLVTRHADVRQVLMDPRFSNRVVAARPEVAESEHGALISQSLIGMDPPEHTRIRRLVTRAFSARRVERLRPRVAELVDGLIDALEELPRPVDVVRHFAVPLPTTVICEMLGVPEADRAAFQEWSNALVVDWLRDEGERNAATAALRGYFTELIAAKRAEPGDDLMTELIAAREEGNKLSESELVAQCIGLLSAGNDTTASLIAMFLMTLLRRPDELARLRAEPAEIPRAVEELLRYVPLAMSGAGGPRLTTEEVELGGVTIPPGKLVLPAIAAANRDPEVFADPERLDLDRTDNQHLGFGAGIHFCLGAQLARVELQEALAGLLRRLPGLRLAVPEEELRMKPASAISGLEALPVEW
ncbi:MULTISPECIES: cytochrome P450 [Streptomycetaceae]|uniref:cytochrome P450 n=1 Tax=Streptomycetaceae TaxID=2062 RepID=UPI000213FA6A|nr:MULTISPECIES: cytochrome P450 [Streptomycetaceae]MYS60484.1 cytochrome P450 [Streptomyces sp. SID5468]CCB76284.1 Cytochrome P450 107B1 [Streptantibioticus cattleyicolor NRRL 8057 = DSM 46488]